MPFSCSDYHDLHLKSTTATKLFDLSFTGSTDLWWSSHLLSN